MLPFGLSFGKMRIYDQNRLGELLENQTTTKGGRDGALDGEDEFLVYLFFT